MLSSLFHICSYKHKLACKKSLHYSTHKMMHYSPGPVELPLLQNVVDRWSAAWLMKVLLDALASGLQEEAGKSSP